MALSEDDVRSVASLARLALTDDEITGLVPELNAILQYAERVNEVAETADVAPTTHPFPLTNVFRADEPGPTVDRDVLLAGGPQTDGERFVVPRIVAEDA